MRLKQLGERTYCMENEPCRRSSVYKNYFIGRASSGRDRKLRSKILTPSSLTLSLLSARNRVFLETWSCSKRAPSLNIWPSLNIEPTLSQISEETLESLRERNSRKNFERQTAPSKPPEGHPQSDATQRRVGSLKPQTLST